MCSCFILKLSLLEESEPVMIIAIILLFVIGYVAIALEHTIKINKAAIALLTGVACWTVYIVCTPDHEHVVTQLLEHVSSFSGILFFLMGAMTIVELIAAHEGFDVITNRIGVKSKRQLLWVTAIIAFFLSAVLDNLTTTIVMISLLLKFTLDKEERLIFVSMVVIAANAGGAWTPIGDVTTTMLWIGGQITTQNIMAGLFLPSVICLLVPLLIVSPGIKGLLPQSDIAVARNVDASHSRDRNIVLFVGLGGLLFVPVFKTLTHLPPFMGILLVLGVLWFLTERMHLHKVPESKKTFSVSQALTNIDMSSVLFFLGILICIAALESTGVLAQTSTWLDATIGNISAIDILIGLLSAVVDNVPLVAGAMGLYPLSRFGADHHFWIFLAYCAGTGGSILIIGSAAGVVAMGLAKIDFMWYLRKISLLALAGYCAGAGVYLLQGMLLK